MSLAQVVAAVREFAQACTSPRAGQTPEAPRVVDAVLYGRHSAGWSVTVDGYEGRHRRM